MSDIPNLTFLPDGTYDLSTLDRRAAAAEAALRVIGTIPMAYYSRGPEFCRDAMARQAGEVAGQLQRARAADVATPGLPELKPRAIAVLCALRTGPRRLSNLSGIIGDSRRKDTADMVADMVALKLVSQHSDGWWYLDHEGLGWLQAHGLDADETARIWIVRGEG